MVKILGIFPKANEIGIFVYAGALFFFVVYTVLSEIWVDPYLIGIFVLILILLVYRYFHEIKFGGLSLRRDMAENDNKFEAFKSSSSTEIIKLIDELAAFKTSSTEEILNLKKLTINDNSSKNNLNSENNNEGVEKNDE